MVRTLIAALAVFLCGPALSAGAVLFNSVDIVSPANEAAYVSPVAKSQIARMRANTALIKSVQVVKLNRSVLTSGVLTLVTPAGKTREFVGKTRPIPGSEQLTYWWGRDSQGIVLTMTFGDEGFYAEVRGDGENFNIVSMKDDPATIIMFDLAAQPPMDDDTPPAPPKKALRK